MVNLDKSQPPPPCLETEKEKANGDYKCGNVLDRIKEDFKNKCYICEYEEPPSINVEHFLPHRGNKDLKFDWNNLFWSCAHCNNTKSDKFDNILNCTNPEHDVENWMKYEMKPFPGEEVKITPINQGEMVENTIKLLMAVYNGTTPLKVIESANIRKALLEELLDFQEQLLGYYDADIEDDERSHYLKKIKKHLKKSSPFTAFKRWIIKENPVLKQDFQQYFD
jgi:uncharacterized protein (TIGR02646 family)